MHFSLTLHIIYTASTSNYNHLKRASTISYWDNKRVHLTTLSPSSSLINNQSLSLSHTHVMHKFCNYGSNLYWLTQFSSLPPSTQENLLESKWRPLRLMSPCGLSRGMCCVYMRKNRGYTLERVRDVNHKVNLTPTHSAEMGREPIHVHFVLLMVDRNP